MLSTQPSHCPSGTEVTTSPLAGTLDSEEKLKDGNRGFVVMELYPFLERIEKSTSLCLCWSFLTHILLGGDIKMLLMKHRSARLQLCAFSTVGWHAVPSRLLEQRSRPFCHQGLVSWKTIFLRTGGGGLGGMVQAVMWAMGSGRWSFALSLLTSCCVACS